MDKFFAQAAGGKKESSASQTDSSGEEQKPLPKGVVIGKDGKPCRTCTSTRDWLKLAKSASKPNNSSSALAGSGLAAAATTSSLSSSTTSETDPYPSDCPPDVDRLGNHTWTLLHSMSATYPTRASPQQQSDMKQFLALFGRLYPCWVCAEDFQGWMQKRGNEPKVGGRGELGLWMCQAHNEVNRKLGKEEFDCGRWEERWREGWRDGRCG